MSMPDYLILYTIKSLLLSMHRPLHRRGRGGDSPSNNHTRRQRCGAGDFPNQEVLAAKRTVCRGTHSRDSPFDSNGTLPSDNLHRRVCCEQQGADPLSVVLYLPIPRGIRGHPRYPHG